MRISSRNSQAAATLLAALLIVAACSAGATTPAALGSAEPSASSALSGDPVPVYVAASPTDPSWFGVSMTDVNSGQAFRISDFRGKVVLIETMATWCPTCQGEMAQVQQLHSFFSDTDFVSVSLDVDPNEDATVLKKFTVKNNYLWRVAVAPTEVGAFMAKNYDVNYLNPPEQPMLIIDRTGGVWGLPFGIKSIDSLKKTLDPYIAQ